MYKFNKDGRYGKSVGGREKIPEMFGFQVIHNKIVVCDTLFHKIQVCQEAALRELHNRNKKVWDAMQTAISQVLVIIFTYLGYMHG